MLSLDHLAVAGEDLAAARAHAEAALDVTLQPGGRHDVFGTHNRLLGLADGLYLEAIAADPDAPVPDRARWFDLDRFSGPARLANWICRCEDLDAALARLPDGFGQPVDLQRGDLRWRMAVPKDGRLPFDNLAPALIQWTGGGHPAQRLAPSGCGLLQLSIRHPEGAALRSLLAPLLTDARIDIAAGAATLSARFATPRGERTLA